MLVCNNVPPSPAGTSRTEAGASEQAETPWWKRVVKFWVSRRALTIGVAGFLAGYWVLWCVEAQLVWLLAACVPAGLCCFRKTGGDGMGQERMLQLAAAFLVWNLAVGMVRNPEMLAQQYTIEFLVGAVLLPVFLAALWLVCREEAEAKILVRVLVWPALIAAVASLGWWYWVQAPGARLRNPLVYGGLHYVCTGMTFGFAAVLAAAGYGDERSGRMRWITLAAVGVFCLAMMLTLSRGALLGLAFGMSTLLVAKGWRRAWPPVLTAAVVVLGFQFFARVLSQVAFVKEGPGDGASELVLPLEVLTDSPWLEYWARGTNGRSKMHLIGLKQLSSWDKHLTGAGLWLPELELERQVRGMNHFHSLLVATYIHSGMIGLGMLLTLAGMGLRRAWRLSKAGKPEWIALLAFGFGGLLFDGQSACSLVTHPRFETLILWFPLVAIAAAWRNIQAGRQPSSITSR